MDETELTIRVPRDVLEGARQYARQNRTTFTRLVSEYLRQLAAQSDPLADAPIVRRLLGTLPQEVSLDDYPDYLRRKFGQDPTMG